MISFSTLYTRCVPFAFLLMLSAFHTFAQSIDSEEKVYRIYKIQALVDFHAIYMERDSFKYKVISLKVHAIDCSNIQVGQSVSLKLTPMHNFISSLVDCFSYEHEMICLEPGLVRSLYTTTYFTGLCYRNAKYP